MVRLSSTTSTEAPGSAGLISGFAAAGGDDDEAGAGVGEVSDSRKGRGCCRTRKRFRLGPGVRQMIRPALASNWSSWKGLVM